MKTLQYYLKRLDKAERIANNTQESLLKLEFLAQCHNAKTERLWRKYIKARGNSEKYKEIIDLKFDIVL